MLDTISNAFEWIVDLFRTLADFVVNIIMGLANIVTSIPMVVDMLSKSITYLPATVAAFASLTITISIVYLLVGRNTGG